MTGAILRARPEVPRETRAAEVTLAMRQLARRATRDVMTLSLLAWEAHQGGYWSLVSDPAGKPYLTEDDFWSCVLGTDNYRSAAKRIAIGRALAALPESERERAADGLAEIGLAKAAIIAPHVVECAEAGDARAASEEMRVWTELARLTQVQDLQRQVSDARGAQPRGLPPEGQRALRALQALMPDLESRNLLADVLRAGERVCGSANPTAILIAALQEALAAWAPMTREAS